MIASTQLPADLIVWRLIPDPVLIVILWVTGLVLLQRAGSFAPTADIGMGARQPGASRGHSRKTTEKEATSRGVSTAKSAGMFAVAAPVTLVAGVILERSGEAAAGDTACQACSSAERCSPLPPRCPRCRTAWRR